MPGALIHISTTDYEDGRVVALQDGDLTLYHAKLIAENRAAAEGPLEDGRPAGAQSRLTTQYAFEDVYYAYDYGSLQYKDKKLFIYEVEMTNPTKVPMAMVDAIRKATEADGVTKAQLNALVREYWEPTQEWNVYEFLAGSMTILKKLDAPDMGSMEAMGVPNDYTEDCELATKLMKWVLAGKAIPPPPAADADNAAGEE